MPAVKSQPRCPAWGEQSSAEAASPSLRTGRFLFSRHLPHLLLASDTNAEFFRAFQAVDGHRAGGAVGKEPVQGGAPSWLRNEGASQHHACTSATTRAQTLKLQKMEFKPGRESQSGCSISPCKEDVLLPSPHSPGRC